MTKKNNEIKKIKKLCEKWIYRLGLRWWEVEIHYVEDPQDVIDIFKTNDNEIVIGRTYVDWKYMSANVYLNVPSMLNMTHNQIERIIVHELLHILVNEMRENSIEHEERVVTGLTKAVFWIKADIERK